MLPSKETLDPSVNAYFNALLRETGPWPWHPESGHFSITHSQTGEILLIPCRHYSRAGRHLLGPDLWLDGHHGLSAIPFLDAVAWTLSLPELAQQATSAGRKNLCHRVAQSRGNLLRAIAQKRPQPSLRPQDFIQSEQALAHGHSIHPCPKDLGNMSAEEIVAFAPEYGGRFPLIWYGVHTGQLQCHDSNAARLDDALHSLQAGEPPDLRRTMAEARNSGQVVVPCHPLQHRHWQTHPSLRELQAQGHLRCLGMGASRWQATSSLRAIWAEDQPWMLKFSLSVRITNSLRHLQPQEAVRGPLLADLLNVAPAQQWLDRHPHFRVLNEPATAVICDPKGQPLPDTTLVIRHNPFRGDATRGCELLASLLQDDPDSGESRLATCLKARHAGAGEAQAWFGDYLDLAVKPLLDAQSNLGLLFGAHQQNLILRLDDRFRPVAAWFRDCQGTGFSALAYRRFGTDLAEAVLTSRNELPDELAVRLFCYYLFINSTFNVITSLAAAGLCAEQRLLDQLRRWLEQRRAENPVDRSALDYLLGSPQLYAKNNFLCSLRAINENTLEDLQSIYHPMPNPLVVGHHTITKDEHSHDTLIAH